jgi:hypothetical protein
VIDRQAKSEEKMPFTMSNPTPESDPKDLPESRLASPTATSKRTISVAVDEIGGRHEP